MINPIGFSFNKELSPIRTIPDRIRPLGKVINLFPNNIEKPFQYIVNFFDSRNNLFTHFVCKEEPLVQFTEERKIMM